MTYSTYLTFICAWCLSGASAFVLFHRDRVGGLGLGACDSASPTTTMMSDDSRCQGGSQRSPKILTCLWASRMMPFEEYRGIVSSLESVLDEVRVSMAISQDLTRRMEALSSALDVDSPLDNCDYDNDVPQDQHTKTTTTPGQQQLSLKTALERALSTSQKLGRCAPETELAWIQVRQVAASLQQDDIDQSKRHDQQQQPKPLYALLAHPSYRHSYGEFLLRSYSNNSGGGSTTATAAADTTNNSTSRQLQTQARTIQQSVQQLQLVVRKEKITLRDREQRRSILVDKLNKSWS